MNSYPHRVASRVGTRDEPCHGKKVSSWTEKTRTFGSTAAGEARTRLGKWSAYHGRSRLALPALGASYYLGTSRRSDWISRASREVRSNVPRHSLNPTFRTAGSRNCRTRPRWQLDAYRIGARIEASFGGAACLVGGLGENHPRCKVAPQFSSIERAFVRLEDRAGCNRRTMIASIGDGSGNGEYTSLKHWRDAR